MNPTDTPRRTLAIIGVMVVLFLSAIDGTIVGTAMPAVIAAIGGIELYPWTFSAFMLASTVVMPFFGKLSDILGARRTLFLAVGLFLAGSAACGASSTMPWLIAARVLQGFGAGGITTMTFVAIGALFAPAERGRAQGILSVVWGVSSLLGPLTGGLLVTHFPWPWIFWINLPAGLVALIFIAIAFPDSPERRPHEVSSLDAVLLSGGLTTVMFALSAPSVASGLAGLVGLLMLVVFGRRQLTASEPLIPLDPFRRRTYALSALVGFLSCVTMFTALTYVPLLIQGVWARPAPEAGAAMTPMMVSWPIAGALAGLLVNRLGFRTLAVTGAVVMVGGYGLLAFGGAQTVLAVSLYAILLGAGMGFVTATGLVAAQSALPKTYMATGSATLALTRNIGAAVGVSVLGGMQWWSFQTGLAARGLALDPAKANALLQAPAASGGEVAAIREALAGSLGLVFTVSFGVAVLTLAVALLLPAMGPVEASRLAEDV